MQFIVAMILNVRVRINCLDLVEFRVQYNQGEKRLHLSLTESSIVLYLQQIRL